MESLLHKISTKLANICTISFRITLTRNNVILCNKKLQPLWLTRFVPSLQFHTHQACSLSAYPTSTTLHFLAYTKLPHYHDLWPSNCASCHSTVLSIHSLPKWYHPSSVMAHFMPGLWGLVRPQNGSTRYTCYGQSHVRRGNRNLAVR